MNTYNAQHFEAHAAARIALWVCVGFSMFWLVIAGIGIWLVAGLKSLILVVPWAVVNATAAAFLWKTRSAA